MRGHEKLIEIRKAGRKPKIVFINDYPCRTDWFTTGDHVTICVAGDDINSLDLRFVVGCMVSATGDTETRAKQLLEACKRAGATTVAATA